MRRVTRVTSYELQATSGLRNKFAALLKICSYVLLFSACSYRPLTYDNPQEGIPFRITPEWSALAAGVDKPQYIKALFFPVDGGETVERFVSPDGEQVYVPVGEYRVIVYNWRTNAATQTVQFRGNTYDTFEAYVSPRNVTMTTRAGRTLSLLPRPDLQLYGWNSGEETVVISATSPTVRTRGTEGNTLLAPMRSLVRHYVVAVHVANAEYLDGMSALTVDARGTTPLGGGSQGTDRYAVESIVERGEEVDGIRQFCCQVTTFGLFDDSPKSMVLDVTNTSGATQRVEVDITDAVARVDMGEVPADDSQVVIPPEDPIVVNTPDAPPPGGQGGGFTPPVLGDWEEENKDIFL